MLRLPAVEWSCEDGASPASHGDDRARAHHEGLRQRLRRRRRRQPLDRRRRVHRPRRAFRLRQVDAPADGRRARGGHRGRDPDRRRRRHRPRAATPRHRDGLPELRALPAHDACARTSATASRCGARRRPRSRGASRRSRACSASTELLDRRPAQLSGGQRQRVAMGRAIVREPRAFLMDEPLSNLDAKLRVGMRASLAQLHARLGVTTIYVTHDQTEAMTLGQRVAVMRDGRIVQVDEPQALYAQPAGRVRRRVHRLSVDEPRRGRRRRRVVRVRPARDPARPGPTAAGATAAWCSASGPRRSRTPRSPPPSLPRIEVQVDVLEQLGADTHACFRVDARRPEVDLGSDADDDGAAARADDALHGPDRSALRPRGRVRALTLAVDPAAFHFFDLETGAALAAEPETATDTRAGGRWHPRRTGLDHDGAPATKQSETRSQVLDLIEQLGVGEAIPSERQLSTPPRRLAAHGPRGARRARARRAARAPPRQRHVRQRAEDRAGADDDVLHRGHAAARHDARVAHARSPGDARRRPSRPVAARLALRAGGDHQPPAAGGSRDDGDRDAPRPRGARPGALGARSRAPVVLRAPRSTGTGSTSSAGSRRSSPRSRTRRSPRPSACRSTHRPSCSSARRARRRGEIVEYVRSIYRGDRYRLVTELNRGRPAAPGNGQAAQRSDGWSVPDSTSRRQRPSNCAACAEFASSGLDNS